MPEDTLFVTAEKQLDGYGYKPADEKGSWHKAGLDRIYIRYFIGADGKPILVSVATDTQKLIIWKPETFRQVKARTT